ncbi:MAG: hypothetical protein ACXVCS_07325 [Bdellovibrionota bacterium]
MRFILTLALLASQPAFAKYEAHEWGTFTSLVWSNGITQNGMYHEDEPLPDFVHGFGAIQPAAPQPVTPPPFRPQPRPCHSKICFGDGNDFFDHNVVTQKMETPVIYFYSDQDRQVDVNVRFPQGVVTDTFPAPIATSPTTGDIRELANGNTTFHVEILPQTTGNIPYVNSNNIYSHARNTASNLVKINNEQEKFIFYRGIGRFQPRMQIGSSNGGLGLYAENNADRPQAIFLVHVNEQGHGQLTRVGMYYGEANVEPATIQALEDHSTSRKDILSGEGARNALISALSSSGLYTDEAIAMVDTWENGYLKVPGLRLLYILPRTEADSVLPLTITPAPDSLKRVFVGRIEVLLDTDEAQILARILKERDAFQVSSLGRFAEPTLRRILEVVQAAGNPDSQMVALINKLITTAAHQ